MKRRDRAPRQYACHRSHAGCADSHVRADFRSALQSRRHAGRRFAGRLSLARSAGLYCRSNRRRLRRRCGRSPDVWRAVIFRFAPCPIRQRPTLQRIYRDVRASLHHLGLRPAPVFSSAVRRRRLHHGSVLVHVLDIVCQSRRHASPSRVRDIRRHPSSRYSRGSSRRNSPERWPQRCYSDGWCLHFPKTPPMSS
jgi:hypothetical protein